MKIHNICRNINKLCFNKQLDGKGGGDVQGHIILFNYSSFFVIHEV